VPQSIYAQKHILRAVRLRGDFCEEGDGDALCRRSRRSNTPENRSKRPSPFQSTRLDEVSVDEIMLSAVLTRGGLYISSRQWASFTPRRSRPSNSAILPSGLGARDLDYTGPMDKLMRQLVTAYLAP
jgi:hypothetical protein